MTDEPRGDNAPTPERLLECFSYDAETGVLRWKIRPTNNVAIGAEAGCFDHRGYRVVRLDRKLFLAHRIAWVLHYGVWPEGDLDHENQNKSDNRISNLRLASRTQNIVNAPSRSRNGLPKGCYRLRGRRLWYSQIRVDGKVKRLGTFATVEAAAAAFEQAHRAAHGAFSHCEAR
jgi:hypothetical protein